jgi:hypothetical protein
LADHDSAWNLQCVHAVASHALLVGRVAEAAGVEDHHAVAIGETRELVEPAGMVAADSIKKDDCKPLPWLSQ